MLFPVIPAKAGIQCFQVVIKPLDPGFRRGDDFLRVHQDLRPKIVFRFILCVLREQKTIFE
jgi:hypothetical protein